MRAIWFVLWVALVVAGFSYPLIPQNGIEYAFVGTGTKVSVSEETELVFQSDRAFGLSVNGEMIKPVSSEDRGWFYLRLLPGQDVEVLGSPWNQKVYVNATSDRAVISTRIAGYGWARAASSPFATGAFVVLIWGLMFMVPVKVDGMWVNVWLALQFRKQEKRTAGDRYPEVMAAIGKYVEAIAYPLVIWISICLSIPVYVFLSFLQMIVFGL